MNGWIAIKDRPAHGREVLLTYKNSNGNRRIVVGYFYEADKEEAGYDDDGSSQTYNEEKDAYYYNEGWYELQDNWGDYAAIWICEGDITHWQPLPMSPG